MLQKRYIGIVLVLLAGIIPALAQTPKAERDYIRRGNRAFRDSMYVNAEVNYRKALEAYPKSTISMYNLGNTLRQQNKFQEAVEQYVNASKIEKDKMKLAQIYHNMGEIYYSQQDYPKAVEAYKESLRNNPKDDETRYNLALAQKKLKEQEANQQEQPQNPQNQEQQEQDNKKEEQKEQQQQQEQQSSENQQDKEQMSKENAEQLLNAVMQDEKDVQDKVKKQMVIQGTQLEKDW